MDDTMREEQARIAALRRIDRAERGVKLSLAAAALVEAVLLASFIALADFGDRLHVLLFVATLLVYLTLGLGLVALGAFVRQGNAHLLQAIELSRRASAAD